MDLSRRQFLKVSAASFGSACFLFSCQAHRGGAGHSSSNAGVGSSSGSGQESADYLQTSFFAFDTVCVIGGAMTQVQLDYAEERCRYFESVLSASDEASDVSRINVAQGEPVQVAAETAALIEESLRYSRESDGLFDITIGAVSLLWDFKHGVVPDDESIQAALPHIGYENVIVEGTTVRLADPSARIDLGGIAKGFIADDLIATLEQQGVSSAFVNLGGNVKVLGPKQDGAPWKIGVRDPNSEREDDVIATLTTEGGSLVTSGLYERRFEYEGREYWHILNPHTGYPVQSDIVSVSIFSQASLDGDGFSKPLFMMDLDSALEFLSERPGIQGLLVLSDGRIVSSPESSFSF